jgi:hypothetical protein
MDGTPRVESSGSAGHSILRYVVYETRLEQSDIGQIATQSPSKPANVSIRLLCPPALCLPIPNSGDASLLLSGQFGVPALGDVSPPASRIPVVRWRVFNDSHELMVSDPPRMQLCVPTNPLSRSRTSQRSEHRGRYVETTVATDDEPSETMPFVIPLDRRSSTGNPTSAVASHQPGQLSFDPLRKRMVDRKPADVSKLLQEWCPRSRTTTRDDQFLRRFLVYDCGAQTRVRASARRGVPWRRSERLIGSV